MSTLSTHILDTTLGVPAVGIALTLSKDDVVLFSAETGTDGRWRCPDSLVPGSYRLSFRVAAYFAAMGAALADPPFFDTVPIDFTIASNGGHYHVPLLVSPYGYSTYRGS